MSAGLDSYLASMTLRRRLSTASVKGRTKVVGSPKRLGLSLSGGSASEFRPLDADRTPDKQKGALTHFLNSLKSIRPGLFLVSATRSARRLPGLDVMNCQVETVGSHISRFIALAFAPCGGAATLCILPVNSDAAEPWETCECHRLDPPFFVVRRGIPPLSVTTR
jgi:hypothetical protein